MLGTFVAFAWILTILAPAQASVASGECSDGTAEICEEWRTCTKRWLGLIEDCATEYKYWK